MKRRGRRGAAAAPPAARAPAAGAARSAFSLHAPPGVSEGEARVCTWAALGLVLLLGAALLAMDLGPHRIGDYFTETDFYGAYADGARLIQHGHLIPGRYGVVGPVYETILALVGFVTRDLFVAANAISMVSTMATLLLWFYLLKRRTNARLALLAALFLASNAFFFRYGYSASTDALAMALQAAALFALLALAGTRAAVLAGALAGLAFLTRYNAIYLLPAGLLTMWFSGGLQERPRRVAAAFALGFVLPVGPWVLYSLLHPGGMNFSLHHNVAYEVFAHARGLTWDDYQEKLEWHFRTPWDVIAYGPGAVAGRLLFNLWDHLRLDAQTLLGWPVAAAAALGLVFAAQDGTLRKSWPLWLCGGLLYLTLVPVAHSGRYSMALLPIYTTLAAATFASPWLALAAGRSRVPLKPALALIPLALAGVASVAEQKHTVWLLPREALRGAETLRQLKRPGDRVIARKAQIGFHAGVETVMFPFSHSYAELAKYARGAKARWIFYSWPEAEMRPEFTSLLDTSGAVPGLTPRFVSSQSKAGVLYEIGPGFGQEPSWAADRVTLFEHQARARLMLFHEDPESLLMLGRIENLRGNLAPARQLLQRAVIANPRKPEAWMLLGDVSTKLGEVEGALNAYDHAASLDPGNADIRMRQGWASLAAGRGSEAAAFWRPLIPSTRDAQLLERMLELFHTLGDNEAARAAEARLREVGMSAPGTRAGAR